MEDDVSSAAHNGLEDTVGQSHNESSSFSVSSRIFCLGDIPWYHGNISRNTAEALLLANGIEGTYLLRKSERFEGNYAISVRCHDSIKHYAVNYDKYSGIYTFGIGQFDSLEELIDHFKCLPVLGGETGPSITLRYPYSSNVPEPKAYEKVVRHGECGKSYAKEHISSSRPDLHIASKEGYLVKLGAIRKSWKRRWFVMHKNTLKYFQNRDSSSPKRTIDIKEAVLAKEDDTQGKRNCFLLALPSRTFFFVASTSVEAKEWLDMLCWKIDYYKDQENLSMDD